MITHTSSHYLIAALTIHLASASLAHAFEQSSYFIFDIVGTEKVEPTRGRLAVTATAITKIETEHTDSAPVKAERGEFEIDFNQPLQAGGKEGATFTFDQTIEAPSAEIETNSFGTKPFGSGTNQSVFGE